MNDHFGRLGNHFLVINTAWKVSKYVVISGPYFPVFGLNTEIVRIWTIFTRWWAFSFFMPCLVSKTRKFSWNISILMRNLKDLISFQILLNAQQSYTSLSCWEKHQTNFSKGQNTINLELRWHKLTSLSMTY